MLLVGCSQYPSVTGSSVLLNMQPAPPAFSSTYDFDLLDNVRGHACVDRERAGEGTTFWVSLPGFVPTKDRATNEAIGAAAFAAISSLSAADTILLMRIVTTNESDQACATVFGRGVKVWKTGSEKNSAPALETKREDMVPSLDRELVETTIKSVMNEIRQCATFEHGTVKLSVAVAANGSVSSVTVVHAAKDDLGECVANEVKKAVFPPSRNGGSFSYPFDL